MIIGPNTTAPPTIRLRRANRGLPARRFHAIVTAVSRKA